MTGKACSVRGERIDSQKKEIAVSVGKHVHPLATQRNVLKRRIRSIIRSAMPSGWSWVLTARRGALEMPYEALKKEIVESVKRFL